MNPVQAIHTHIDEIERHVAALQQEAGQGQEQQEKSAGLHRVVAALLGLVTQTEAEGLSAKLSAIESTIDAINKAGSAPKGSVETLRGLTASLCEVVTGKTAAVDEDAKRELELYMENESRLYRQKQDIIKNIMRKMKGGKYNHSLAPKLWMYWVDEGAKMYVREFGGDVKTMFPKQLREELAKEIANDQKKLIEDGEYDSLKVAAEQDWSVTASVKWNEGDGSWTANGEGDFIKKVTITEIKGPGIPLYVLKLTTEKGEFKYKKEYKKLNDAKKDGETWVKSDEDGASLILTDFKKVASQGQDQQGQDEQEAPEEQAKQAQDQQQDQQGQDKEASLRISSEEVLVINEALAHSVMAKVESALKVVEASGLPGTQVAKKDLNTISIKLAKLVEASDLKNPSLRSDLTKLASMADKVHSHFAA